MKYLTRQLFIKICLFELLVLLVLVILSISFVAKNKKTLADYTTDAFRSSILSGDNRHVMLDMPRILFKNFLGVKWQPADTDNGFMIPENLENNFALSQTVQVPIYFDESKTVKAGIFIFYYNRWEFLTWAIGAWLLLLILSVPLIYRERNRLIETYKLTLALEVENALADVAAQVAHDIRSPLAALDALMKDTSGLPEEKCVRMRNVSNRISDIANNLLEHNRNTKIQNVPKITTKNAIHGLEELKIWLLSSLIAPLMSEKRLQFQSKPNLQIDLKLAPESYGLFAKLQPVEFRRMISNLVNNAVEALGDTGTVTVGLSHENGNIILTVADNGKGISPEILAKLGQKGETHGKAGGSGLGLYHARITAEGWGGTLKISSEAVNGTTITVTLPKAEPPDWFVPKLELSAGKAVVVLDDDSTIHQVWKGRFESSRVKEHGVETFSFSTSAQLHDWVKNNPAKAETATYLLDYELLGHVETGLVVAEQLNVTRQSILVTSRWEEPQILAECKHLKIRLIPKGLSGLVPITVGNGVSQKAAESKNNVAVLVDADPLVHMTWEMVAEEKGIRLLVYKNPDDLLADISKLDLATPIYIDSNLGGGVKGEDFAQTLHDKGFTNLVIETGHKPEKFAHLTFLKSVQSKNPPWQ